MNIYDIDGKYGENDIVLKDVPLFININESIPERNVYTIDTKEQFNVIRPQKYGGLSYRVYSFSDDFCEIETASYGRCYVKMTQATPLSNYPFFERGDF